MNNTMLRDPSHPCRAHATRPFLLLGATLAAATLLGACGGSSGGDPVPPPVSATVPTAQQLAASCTALNGTKVDDVSVTATRRVEASGDYPAFCQVSGTRAPYLDMEVVLPDGWSGRLWQQGGSGFDGTILSAITSNAGGQVSAMNLAVKTGLAVYATSNGGNRASVPEQAGPLVWANGSLDGVLSAKDYAYAAVDTTREFAKKVSKNLYGKLPAYTYFNGCSNGGRNAYLAAERTPLEYDGIVSGCETMDMGGQTAAWMNMASRVNTAAMPSDKQWGAITAAAVAACDSLDGITDGVIAKPGACTLNVATLQCGAGTASSDPTLCLSPAQVATARDLTSDILMNGTVVYSGWTWTNWLPTTYGRLGGGFALLASGDRNWAALASKQQSYNLATDYAAFQFGLRQAGADHDKSKVAGYVASGRKLLSWHSSSDNLLSFNDHVRNYAAMTASAKAQGLADPSANTRFFAVPGAVHGEGQLLTEVNWFNAITAWVETKAAPEQLLFNKSRSGTPRTLPVCQHPKYPHYNGGDVNLAASYRCVL